MLTALSIRNIILIEKLDLSFKSGLCVLTGETGAGKSILLDALGLALGARLETGLLRQGSESATVTASFEIPAEHPTNRMIVEHGIETEDVLMLRRTLNQAGRTRAFINDQPTSVGLLKQVGESLIEIQGQFEQHGLLDTATHLSMLDAYGNHHCKARQVRDAYRIWREARDAHEHAAHEAEKAREDESYLRHALEEIDTLDPQEGEDAELTEARRFLMQAEQIVEAIQAAQSDFDSKKPVSDSLRAALRKLERLSETSAGRLDAAIASLDRALEEVETASDALSSAANSIDMDENRLNQIEERLFTLRELARKHRVDVETLPALHQSFRDRLALIDDQSDRLEKLKAAVAKAREDYSQHATILSTARAKAAKSLDAAVNAELPPLKLEKAAFTTELRQVPEDEWSENGVDRTRFMVATNPGEPVGPIGRIASGGELSRFMLALKLVLSSSGDQPSLVFDEVDSGVGGATAHAVGERLGRLADSTQLLVITHSPQVAARGSDHLRVLKAGSGKRVVTDVERLGGDDRLEEVARMISGAAITEEARAAAGRLIEGGAP
ncbi:MAG: DNA repair protein RecN [Alphaproteobacteria bacterium]|nr:DNA repair protein RecN [Alphaproteobacteria bacterium]